MSAYDPTDANPSNTQQKLQSDSRQLARDLDDLLAQLPNLTGEAIETAKQTFLAKAAQGPTSWPRSRHRSPTACRAARNA
ncbi:hypothetical protein [Cupriavidus sp. EM10]|uniref:hypothetical protein n=1 Tax=Cupriavidus sp. EM10 TaxID=2839983 RepID=UPI001C000013|nr:hypothetical protein [Cupriavidus sp. EM10]QWE97504.1 hypothetical protein KLP38_21025 [Cupriavidus sp. EM10]